MQTLSSLNELTGISARRAAALVEAGISSPKALLNLPPNRYLDRSTVKYPREAIEGETATFVGTILTIQDVRNGKRSRLECVLSDGRGTLKGVWFNSAAWIKKQLVPGTKAALFGQVKRFGRFMSIAHPDFETLDAEDDLELFSRVIPVYPNPKAFQNAGIGSGLISRWMRDLISKTFIPEYLPFELLRSVGVMPLEHAYRALHIPNSIAEAEKAKERLAFDELFLFQSALVKLKLIQRERAPGIVFSQSHPYTAAFFNTHLPFTLTEGQRSALSEIKHDTRSGFQMNRLVQGDVGAGKTIVGIGGLLLAIDNGYQSAFMAPTELLAEQHFRTISKLLEPLDLNIRLLTGSQTNAVRQDVLTAVSGGHCQILVGTHALIQERVTFFKLGLVVVDEQHRFGVAQRQALGDKGANPHILVMSATPIPRSLALTAYGNMDVSIVKGLPSGRKPVETVVIREMDRDELVVRLKSRLEAGEQIFVVYPLIEESEVIDLRSATYGWELYSSRLAGFNVALLHGRMKKEERDGVMQAFLRNEIQVLVSTTVIEVGIDIPNATTIVIEHAERFGLAQLHQLRGRVGRGALASFCFLVAGKAVSKDGWQRLRLMERTNDGFLIAEEDLKIRGPGDFLGTKQSGLPEFMFADIVRDQAMLLKAREAAEAYVGNDAVFNSPEMAALKDKLRTYLRERMSFFNSL